MNVKYPERKLLAHLPTPLEKPERLSRHLGGPDIYMKRDDQTGLATGGNKTRKLEFLVADALAQGCDHLVTTGAPQSNHCRQTAAAAAHFGLGCSLVLRGKAPTQLQGNLLLDKLLGAHLYWTGDNPRHEVMAEVANEQRVMGHRPYLIPLGGSNVMGATSYVMAMQELMAQLAATSVNIDFIVFASSSGGTQAHTGVGIEHRAAARGEIRLVVAAHVGRALPQARVCRATVWRFGKTALIRCLADGHSLGGNYSPIH